MPSQAVQFPAMSIVVVVIVAVAQSRDIRPNMRGLRIPPYPTLTLYPTVTMICCHWRAPPSPRWVVADHLTHAARVPRKRKAGMYLLCWRLSFFSDSGTRGPRPGLRQASYVYDLVKIGMCPVQYIHVKFEVALWLF